MASEGQSEGTEHPPELPAAPLQSNGTFQWGAILAAVKDQLPSLDSDTSTSDCESDGELFIFHREQPNLIPDLSEELMDFSLEDSNVQQTQKTERCPWGSWNGVVESSGFQKKTDGAHIVVKEDAQMIKVEASSLASHTGEILSQKGAVTEKSLADSTDHLEEEELGKRQPREGGNSWLNTALSMEELGSQKERRKLIETKILSKITLEPSPGHPELDIKPPSHGVSKDLDKIVKEETSSDNRLQELTHLSLQNIEKDLDKILEELEQQKENTCAEVVLFSADHETFRNRSENQLMEKLEELCARYSRTVPPRCRWPPAKPSSFQEQQENKKDVALLSSSRSSGRMDMMRFRCLPEPGTVYIDLRDAKPHKSVTSPDEEESASDSSTEEEETIKDQAERRMRNCSGKSLLLQQLRTARKEASELLHKTSIPDEKLEGIKQDPESPEETGFSKISQKQYFKANQETNKAIPRTLVRLKPEKRNSTLTSHGDDGADIEKENKMEAETVQNSGNALESPLTATEWPRTEESKRELFQKEEQMKERQRRQRFQERLERVQPQQSVTGKQPMAEKTPVLFHMEASYLPDIDTLPGPESMKNEVLLMNIWLLSCGQVAPVQRGGQEPDLELRAANIYQALVTWLLSLVPPVTVKAGPKAPFWVVGLQQAWQEDGLALYVCLMPADEPSAQNSTESQKINAKENLQGTSTFYQKISAFLARTRLPDVLWWRAELANRFQNQPCPLLPEIPSVLLSYIAAVNPDPQAVEKVFAVPSGFYWQTVETGEKYFPSSSDIQACRDTDTEVAMVLLFETLFRSPLATHHTLELVLGSGLDVCGLRLLYPQEDMLLSSSEKLPSSYTSKAGEMPPVLALGVRGPKARSTLQNVIGPSDPQLASVTDCGSINAIYCRSQEEPLLYLPHLETRVHRELCLWFGGRAAGAALWADVLDPDSQCDSTASSQSPSLPGAEADEENVDLQGMVLSRPPAMLVATTKGDIVLVVSPVVSPHAYGDVISVCTRWGFLLQGVRRLQLSSEQALVLSMTSSQIAAFCPSKISSSPDRSAGGELSAEPRLHCLILLLRKENAAHHIPALTKGLMGELAKQGLLGSGQSSQPDPAACFHGVPYTEALMETLGGDLSGVPDPRNILLHLFCDRTYASDPDMEQVVMLAVVGMEAMKSAGDLLHQILLPGEGPDSGFELLGLKWLPRLTRRQAREITPFEVGDTSWRRSLDLLMSHPVLVCALRRIDAFGALANALKRLMQRREKLSKSESLLQTVMALTPEVTFRQAALFFTETDFVTDAEHRPAMKYLPPSGNRPRAEGAQILCTVLLIKPGAWSHSLARILRKLDLEKFHVVGMKHINLEADVALGLLSSEVKQVTGLNNLTDSLQSYLVILTVEGEGEFRRFLIPINPGEPAHSWNFLSLRINGIARRVPVSHTCAIAAAARGPARTGSEEDPAALEAHCSYLTSGTALVLCLQRQNAVKKLIDILGPEDPKLAQAQDPFLWRAQYGTNIVQNGFYGSKSYQIAVRDMKLFFPEGLCCAECQTLEEEEIYNLKRDPIVGLGINRRRKMVKRETGARRRSPGSEQPCGLADQSLLDNLCQTTCLVLPGIILRGSERPSYIELLEQLIGKDFTVTGARLTVLDAPQAHCLSETLSRAKCSVAAKCSLLMDGLCLVLAAQRDSAVLCFGSLLDSVCWQKESVLDTAQHLLYPQNEKQAEDLLCCLFDSLTSESTHRIESQDC